MASAIIDVTRRADLIAQAWRRLRPLKTYSSLSVEDFVEGAKPSTDVRAVLKELDGHTKATQKRRKLVDANTEALIRRVVHAVQGDKEDGENSEIYAAMGFVPRSQRARRARRRAKEVVKAPAAASAPTRRQHRHIRRRRRADVTPVGGPATKVAGLSRKRRFATAPSRIAR